MTDREIRLEIAKIAMSQGMSVDHANGFYEWIVKEPEKVIVNEEVDDMPIGEIIRFIANGRWKCHGYCVRLERIFRENGINTVGDLLRIGRKDFLMIKDVGKGSSTRIDDALEELYGITSWYKS